MAGNPLHTVLNHLRRLHQGTDAAQRSDRELLHAFAANNDQDAFAAVVTRHAPLVWGVCRRILGHHQDAEDAFQATFLVLARRAGSVRWQASVGSWLHTVAQRLAVRARKQAEKRRIQERAASRTPPGDASLRELAAVVDEELRRLPAKYREPLLLHYLEGVTAEAAARQLGLSRTMFYNRLAYGRELLRARLGRQGLSLAAPLLAAALTPEAEGASRTLIQATVRAVMGSASERVAALAAEALGATAMMKLKIGLALGLLLGVAAGGVAMLVPRAPRNPIPQAERSAEPPKAEDKATVRVDRYGDPLPPGALRRLGTRRHRVQSGSVPWQDMPDGKSYLVSHGRWQDNEIRRLDSVTGRVLETWRAPNALTPIGFSPDGEYVLMSTPLVYHTGLDEDARYDWTLTLYDLAKRKAVWEIHEKRKQTDWKPAGSACFSTDGKWIATTDGPDGGSLCLWERATGKELWQRKQDRQPFKPLGFTEGGKALVVRGCEDNAVYLFDCATGKQRRSFPTMPPSRASWFGLAPDGSTVLCGTYGPSVRLWDTAAGKEKPALEGHKQWVWCFAFSPDGKTIVTGGNDPFVLVRAWPSGKVIRTIDLDRTEIKRMTISGDGRRLEVLFWGEKTLRSYDLITGKLLPSPLECHCGGVYGAALAPDGTLLSFSEDSTVRFWDPRTGKAAGRLVVEQDLNGGGFALSHDGRLLATTASAADVIHVRERATGKLIHKLPAERYVGKYLLFSSDGRWLAGADRLAKIIQVWDTTSGRTVLKHDKRSASIAWGVSCTFSPDGRQFAASDDGVVYFWDTTTWKMQGSLKAYAPFGLAYSPDGRTLAAAGVGGIDLFELATGQQCAHIGTSPEGVLVFSPTGRWLAWTSRNRKIAVWNVRRGEQLVAFSGHDDAVTGLVFTADDRALISSSQDSTLLVWDIAGTASKKPRPKDGDLDGAWHLLAGKDSKAAYGAIHTLASSPTAAVELLARHLKPIAPIDAKRIDSCLRDLDSEHFSVREKAQHELEKLGDLAEPALRQKLANKPTLEARRRVQALLERLRGPVTQPELLQALRAVAVLEDIGTSQARRLLEELAKGAPEARLTREARASLRRRIGTDPG